MSIEALGCIGVRGKELGDRVSYGDKFLGLHSSLAFRMDDRKQRLVAPRSAHIRFGGLRFASPSTVLFEGDCAMTHTTTIPAAEPKGIGGWLILPMLITLISPLLILTQTFLTIVPALNEDLAPSLRAFVIGEGVFNLGLIAGWIVLAIWLFRRKRSFPRLFIAMLVISLVGQLADSLFALSAYDMPLGPEDYRAWIRSFINLVIWAPYMVKSKRVHNTFTES